MTTNWPTLSETLANLRTEGYTEDFNLLENCLECKNKNIQLFPSDFKIDKYFRFEGPSDPADNSILYAISSDKYDLKGVLVNGYGMYSEPITDDLLKKLQPQP